MWNKLTQDVVSCEKVEHFCLNLKNINIKSINKFNNFPKKKNNKKK